LQFGLSGSFFPFERDDARGFSRRLLLAGFKTAAAADTASTSVFLLVV
jgi:hypothetical protein